MIDPTHQQHPHRRHPQQQLAPATSNNGTKVNKLPVQAYLTNCKSFYSCIYCRTHLADHDELVSRSFQGNNSRAYLFNSVINIRCGPAVQRELNTGHHAVADIYCANCETNLGWKYEKAYVSTQKYKEGKFIIELAHVVRENRHLELDKGNKMLMSGGGFSGGGGGKRSSARTSSTSSTITTDSSSSSSSSPTSSSSNAGTRHSSPADSTTNEEVMAICDDDDEELMFPFYDDMFTGGRSSYPNSLSLSHHNRLRRSLYLDSTPYDWKYFATANFTATDNTSSVAASTASSEPMRQSRAVTQMEQQRTSFKSTSSTSSSTHDDGLTAHWRKQSFCIGGKGSDVEANYVHNDNNNHGTSNSIYNGTATNTNNETQFEIELNPISTCCQQMAKEELDKNQTDSLPAGVLNLSLTINNNHESNGEKTEAASVVGDDDDDDDDEAEEFYDCCTDPNISSSLDCSHTTATRPC